MESPNPVSHLASLLIELGGSILVLALLGRVASRFRFPTIPLYLIGGLFLGSARLLPLSEQFVTVGAEIGVLLLLFMLGLEYSWGELLQSLRKSFGAGLVDIILNFSPGFVTGYFLGFSIVPCILFGGVTYISSSGIASRLILELRRMKDPETPIVVSILVFEDLVMAMFLPVIAMVISSHSFTKDLIWIFLAFALLAGVLFTAARHGRAISNLFCHESDEIILLSTFGAMLLVSGIAQHFQVSAAVGAFLLGIGLSGPIVPRTHRVLGPLRDLFAAAFFFFSGLSINADSIPSVLPFAIVVAVLTTATKLFTGIWACRKANLKTAEGLRAGAILVARGEFSLVIAGLAAAGGYDGQLGVLTAAYVLVMAIGGPVLVKIVDWRLPLRPGP